MFYTQFLLSKKGPLAKIWLAAHWEKKLSKAQVYETSVSDAVEEIMKPKVKMALRTTGHLLLGVVRIYSRRAKYLLEDCNTAVLKINVSFTGSGDRRGVVVDGDGVVPQVMIDFDEAPTDFFNEYESPVTPVPLNQGRLDDITLHEDNNPVRGVDMDDDFGGPLNDDFGENGSNIDELESINVEDARRELSVMSARNHSDVSNVIQPMDDDNFERASQLDQMFGGSNDMEPYEPQDFDMAPMDDHDYGDLGPSFQLDPTLNEANTAPEKAKTTRKRRRLIVDENTTLGGDVMKSNMHDFDDIIQPLDLAPPTKKLMQIKENGIMEKLFSTPGCNAIVDPVIIRLYQSHLVPRAKLVEEEQSIENVRQELGLSDVLEEYNVPDFEPMDFDDFAEIASPPPMEPIEEGNEVDENVEPDMPEMLAPPSPIKETERRTRKPRHAATAAAEESGDEEEDDHRCSKRTHAVATAINTRLNTHESITLNDLLTKSSTRKTAAQKFYALLELAKWQAIEVAQDEPFGEITITTGPQMETVLAS